MSENAWIEIEREVAKLTAERDALRELADMTEPYCPVALQDRIRSARASQGWTRHQYREPRFRPEGYGFGKGGA